MFYFCCYVLFGNTFVLYISFFPPFEKVYSTIYVKVFLVKDPHIILKLQE